MKITLFQKKNIFKKENFGFNFNFYWQLVVFITFVIIIAIIMFSYNIFLQTNNETVVSSDVNDTQVPTVHSDRMKKVLDYFTQREQKTIQILNSPTPVVDPSL